MDEPLSPKVGQNDDGGAQSPPMWSDIDSPSGARTPVMYVPSTPVPADGDAAVSSDPYWSTTLGRNTKFMVTSEIESQADIHMVDSTMVSPMTSAASSAFASPCGSPGASLHISPKKIAESQSPRNVRRKSSLNLALPLQFTDIGGLPNTDLPQVPATPYVGILGRKLMDGENMEHPGMLKPINNQESQEVMVDDDKYGLRPEGRMHLLRSIQMFHVNEELAAYSPQIRRGSVPVISTTNGGTSKSALDHLQRISDRTAKVSNSGSLPSSPMERKLSVELTDRVLELAAKGDPALHRAIEHLHLELDSWGALSPRQRWKTAKDIVASVVYLRRRYPWFQLSGHSDQFEHHKSPEWVLKVANQYEKKALEEMQGDPITKFTPMYKGIVKRGEKEFVQLQNLLFGFIEPCGMDCKMGYRTFLAKDVANIAPRMDLLSKLTKLAPSTVTDGERQNGVTKRKYMEQREVMSSTATLGFRIEAVKIGKENAKTRKGGTLIKRSAVANELNQFIGGNSIVRKNYLTRLRQLRETLKISPFFKTHEVVGSSLLLLHDKTNSVGVWMIDFGKTIKVDMELDHLEFSKDNLTKHEDGYLRGLDNFIKIIERGG